MKIPIASELTRTCITKDLEMLVISKEIDRYKEVLKVSSTLIVGYRKSLKVSSFILIVKEIKL